MFAQFSRIAIVTGATSGIGEATVRRFITDGFGVVGTGRNQKKLDELTAECSPGFHGLAGDATDESLIDELFALAKSKFGRRADIVVANAGLGLGGSLKDIDVAEFENILKLNVAGSLILLQKAARLMEEEQKENYPKSAADIVIVGSISGRHISPFSYVYGSTKFALHALAEGLRRELGPSGVRVSLVEPGLVLTGFQERAGYTQELVDGFNEKFGPLLVGEDVADTVHFIVTQPPHVHISDIVVRPTRQDYP